MSSNHSTRGPFQTILMTILGYLDWGLLSTHIVLTLPHEIYSGLHVTCKFFTSRAPSNILGILQPIGLKFGVSLPVPKHRNARSHTKFDPNRLGSFREMD